MPRATAARTRRTQHERLAATRAQLLTAARSEFAARGYAEAALDAIAKRARVTKGALYHHFADKGALFEAVFEQEHAALAELCLAVYARAPEAWAGVALACRAFFEASLDPAVQRITLLDGPAVLGWERLRAIEDRYSVANLRKGLQLAMAQKAIAVRPVEPLVQMLNGAMCEAAMYVARCADPRAASRQVLAELQVMLDALARPPVSTAARRSRRCR